VYSLHRLLGPALAGASPILQNGGFYSLNIDAGVAVDFWRFDGLARVGDKRMRAGDYLAATAAYQQAIDVYRGDLCVSMDVHAVLERERLRAQYLSILARLADQRFAESDYKGCLEQARRMLDSEPTREDAHRLAMRCYVRRGERAQAMRQYQLCVEILRSEFDTGPEPDTRALFERTRLDPSSV
jgi:DNA-binding SARP family transcriptional activator